MSEAPNAAGAGPESTGTAAPARPPALSILLLVFMVANAAQLAAGLLRRRQMFLDIPRLTPLAYAAWLAGPVAGIAGAIGLWAFRRWGLIAIALGWAMVAAVDLWLGATPHAIIATGMVWLIILFSRSIRGALR